MVFHSIAGRILDSCNVIGITFFYFIIAGWREFLVEKESMFFVLLIHHLAKTQRAMKGSVLPSEDSNMNHPIKIIKLKFLAVMTPLEDIIP